MLNIGSHTCKFVLKMTTVIKIVKINVREVEYSWGIKQVVAFDWKELELNMLKKIP